MRITLWDRYVARSLVKTTALFFCCFFFLYVLIDSTSRSHSFSGAQPAFIQAALYYGLVFLRHVDILLPFALLLATIKTLSRLNLHNEFVALLANGIRMKTLLRPVMAVASVCLILLYINFFFFVPRTLYRIEEMELSERERVAASQGPRHFALPDGSLVLYQRFDSEPQRFFDAYWFRSFDDIFHAKWFSLGEEGTLGHFVDHLVRNQGGDFVVQESLVSKPFPEIRFDEELLVEAVRTPEQLSLVQLWRRLTPLGRAHGDRDPEIASWFYKRLAMPWLCLIVVMAPMSYCVAFTRQFPLLLIYLLGLSGLACFYLFLDAGLVVAQAQVFPPAIAILTPFILCGGFFGAKYYQLR